VVVGVDGTAVVMAVVAVGGVVLIAVVVTVTVACACVRIKRSVHVHTTLCLKKVPIKS